MSEQLSNNHDKENELTRLLAKLPADLREIWREKTDDFSIDAAISTIQDVLKSRDVAKERIFTTINEIRNPSLQEEVRAAVRTVESSFGRAELFVGNGSVAEVYYIPEAPHVCVKYLINPAMAREHGNNFREESQYLNHMKGFIVDGIRVPDLLFYHMSDFGTCFGMEKIDGKSINIITDNPESIDFLEVIKKQDMQEVLKKMRNFITKMHTEKKLVHRDLTARNIMIDRDGNWYVIDFGRARPIEIGDDSTDMSEASDVPTAEGAIRALFAKIS
jgi:tRNA A-37 threonylcarbamoyl transferase component Bud32